MKRLLVLFFIVISILSFVVCNWQRTQEIDGTNQENDLMIDYEDVNENYFDEEQDESSLIPAIGINGVEGYVYVCDIYGEQPSTPEEAIEYMKSLNAEILVSQKEGQEYLRYIPLYKNDGVTIIGEFGISYP